MVWFASIVAGVLCALGFAAFAAEGSARVLLSLGREEPWLSERAVRVGLSLAATRAYAAALAGRAGRGGNVATVGKVIVFAVVIGGGLVAFAGGPAEGLARLDPFFAGGSLGLVQAMGYRFIALQGFDLIAAVGGEVRHPKRNLPRAIYLSLGIALAIYLPLIFLISTVGVGPGEHVAERARVNPEGLVADAAERFLGPAGFWLVILAGVLSMLSALRAKLLGASGVAFSMARDRTLPRLLGRMRGRSGTPAIGVAVTALALAAVVVAIGDVSAAGAASRRRSAAAEPAGDLGAETLFTVAADVWSEIARVARLHRCETVLLGLPRLDSPGVEAKLEALIATLDADVVVLRPPRRFQIADAKRMPLRGRHRGDRRLGRGAHPPLRRGRPGRDGHPARPGPKARRARAAAARDRTRDRDAAGADQAAGRGAAQPVAPSARIAALRRGSPRSGRGCGARCARAAEPVARA